MSKVEDTVPPRPPATTADTAMVPPVFTAVSLPTPASLGLSLPAETIQQIAGAVATILQPSLSSDHPSSSGELPGPSTSSRPSDLISGKCSIKPRTFVHLCVKVLTSQDTSCWCITANTQEALNRIYIIGRRAYSPNGRMQHWNVCWQSPNASSICSLIGWRAGPTISTTTAASNWQIGLHEPPSGMHQPPWLTFRPKKC